MSETVFTKVDYTLGSLMNYIGLGHIGLPDIQRPFVWKNTKVRDLFDSMYKGFPVGYLLFWQNGAADANKTIGTDAKQQPPRLVIVDGQQRLTSLYAVIRNVSVLRENFQSEHIQIAFNPLEERFEVADAAIRRDKAFIPDISVLWAENADLFEVVDRYLAELETSRGVTEDETKLVRKSIAKLQGLLGFPLTALELISDIDEEAVSHVFVRINGTGTPLNQADFILTLMSVFWDEGRADLEDFCRQCRIPSKGKPSPFNHFIEPFPDQLLRVGVSVAFKRARLQYVYSILRGKDLETEKFSTELREQQFGLLKNAQGRVLNLQYWHDFLNCIRMAGYRSGKMISSKNNLLFAYVLYLIGRTEYQANENDLRRVIARWFFMSSVTRRFTDAPESAMEFDLARLRQVDSADGFLNALSHICDITLTHDYWGLSLPNDLATASPQSPSFFAYQAALVLLDAPALFSQIKVASLLDPSTQAIRAAAERHHIFPKGYLASVGITATRDTNQTANFALVEWGDNVEISDQAPADYLPPIQARFSPVDLERMYWHHALPPNWEQLGYREFLERRRELMAEVTAAGYATLVNRSAQVTAAVDEFDLSQIVMTGESEAVEFKSTLRTNLHTGARDPRMELSVLRTLAGFLNTNGGTLCIGVSDDGSPVGIQADGFANEDAMSLHLVNIVKSRLGVQAMTNIHLHFDDHEDCRVLVARCRRAGTPVFAKDGDAEHFYIRTGPSTTELSPSQTQDYIKQRFRA